ncbi:unnamed protein product [Rhizophagus irregularis]|nr:unnamed protein product [Rhizophagus irregularis]
MRPDRPTRNIFFYDIPAHWNEADIIIYLRKVRIINVKANIALNEDKEEEFAKGTFGTNRGVCYVQWLIKQSNLVSSTQDDAGGQILKRLI